VPTPSATNRANACRSTTPATTMRVVPATRAGITAQPGRGCRTCQPVSHHGINPATIPGASRKKIRLPTAAFDLFNVAPSAGVDTDGVSGIVQTVCT
jgi:hypothetical protein